MFKFRIKPGECTESNVTETQVEVVCAITSANAELCFFKIQSSLDLILGEALVENFDCFKIGDEYSSAFVVVHSSNQDLASKPTFGILSPGIQHNIWTLYKLVDDAHIEERVLRKYGGSPLASTTPTSSYHFPKVKKSVLAIKSSSCCLSLRMSPPNVKLSASLSSSSKLSHVDPHAFLAERYFSTLYQSTTPLQYFAKTALPRVHVLSRSNCQLARDTISSFIIRSMTNFNQRFDFGRSSCTSSLNLLNDDELSYRVDFLRNHATKSDEQFRESLDNLRLREAKLQVLLCLDLLRLLNGEEDHQVPTPRRSKVIYTKRPLVGRKKRLIPTLIGTAISVNAKFTTDLRNIQDNSTNELTSNVLKTNINALMDKLCVHDAIMGLSLNEDDSTYRFLISSVVPFFQKSHPKLLRELINKAKGPSASRKSKNSHAEHIRTISPPSPKLRAIAKSDTSVLVNSLEFSHLKLKRKASNLGLTQNLSRKTFDMIKSTSITQQLSTSPTGLELQPRSHTESSLSKTRIKSKISAIETSSIFNHRKRNAASIYLDNSEVQANPYTEVEATPVKKPRASLEIFASPDDLKTAPDDISPVKTSMVSDTHVTATPLKSHQAKENVIQTIEIPSRTSLSSCADQSLYYAETSSDLFANEKPDSFPPCVSPQSGPVLPQSSPKQNLNLQRQSELFGAKEHGNPRKRLTFD
ncbi:hypothetical protein KL935_002556 [Ogataea polymorpha]|uniref:DNA replication regulator Sld3 C-terminal domain-containing protein n=1 Tax=Ogataea polymorpha TaxID=460523 RepID=A0A9P8NRQ6_9ASCO|nr:hypothetical protein KL908_002919 [Ogataea polymorpha]KAG7900623.1 hypothetical protein KL935_002556 [Ogataea polymorpha]KAG7907816.1 hypothetical protein KL906_003233 [Ogataea polymorpha]KAG7916400.1 hypothetical protein KL927_003039 [Ogataea polymorpha]KAG7934130.1 hypothetical protein KL934_003052 [Ogataea polymorpha]